MSGASIPGSPYIAMGRTNRLAWALTSALNDISDLWQEEISKDGMRYKVDGEWQKIQFEEEVIKIKDMPNEVLKVGRTHRGPLFSSELISEANVLFGGNIPKIASSRTFSLGWGYN
jgi:penicillin amidase